MDKSRIILPFVIAVGLGCAPILGAEAVQGIFSSPDVKGGSSSAHGWVDEKIYVGQLATGFGAGAQTIHQPLGWFSIDGKVKPPGFPGGTYALFTLCYDGCPAFSCRANLKIDQNVAKQEKAHLTTPAHYSLMYNKDWREWAEEPWVGGDSFFQTFVATTPHITRIATKLADKSGDHHYLTLNFAVYEPSDGPPSTWKRISPVRSRYLSGGTDPVIHIFWVPFRSNEMTLKPGNTYAVRLWRDPSSQSKRFALVARPDKDDGYAKGHLYVADKALKDLDGYAYVSGGEPGTIVNHAPVGDLKPKDLIGGGRRFGQTFKASGSALAAVDIIYTTGATSPPAMPITFQLYDRPGGTAIGPAKTCYGIPLTFQGRAAAVWDRKDAPLVPGRNYYLEWTCPGANTWQLNEDLPGHAYVDGQAKPKADLAISIVEYSACQTTTKVGTR